MTGAERDKRIIRRISKNMQNFLIFGSFIVASVWVWSRELRGEKKQTHIRAGRPLDVCVVVCLFLVTTEATACLRVTPDGSVFARNCGEMNYRSWVYEDRVRPVQSWLRRLRLEKSLTFILKYEDAVTREDTWIYDVAGGGGNYCFRLPL